MSERPPYRRIAEARIGAPTRLKSSHGDLWSATWADDGELYVASDDSFGFDRAADSNLVVNRVSGDRPPDLTGVTVNPMWEYGKQTEYLEDDGMWKATGIASVDGSLYLGVSRHSHPLGNAFFVQETWDASIIRSDDHGQTWTQIPSLERPMFRGHAFSTPFFVQYGRDGAADVDEADRFVYAVSSDGAWNHGNTMTLGRVARDRLRFLDAGDWAFYHGLDGDQPIFRSRHDTARYVFRAPGRTSMTGLHYVAGLGVLHPAPVALPGRRRSGATMAGVAPRVLPGAASVGPVQSLSPAGLRGELVQPGDPGQVHQPRRKVDVALPGRRFHGLPRQQRP